jgi:hypothetical protein
MSEGTIKQSNYKQTGSAGGTHYSRDYILDSLEAVEIVDHNLLVVIILGHPGWFVFLFAHTASWTSVKMLGIMCQVIVRMLISPPL